MLVDSDDLWQLGGDAENAGAGLQRRHHGRRDERVGDDERVDSRRDERDERARKPGPTLEVQDEDADGDVLDGDQGRLAVGAEGEDVADVVGERDEERGRLEDIGRQAEPLRRARLKQLEDLRDLDDGGGGDDGQAERFGDGEREALGVAGDVEIEEEGAVALGPQKGDEGVVEGRREVRG